MNRWHDKLVPWIAWAWLLSVLMLLLVGCGPGRTEYDNPQDAPSVRRTYLVAYNGGVAQGRLRVSTREGVLMRLMPGEIGCRVLRNVQDPYLLVFFNRDGKVWNADIASVAASPVWYVELPSSNPSVPTYILPYPTGALLAADGIKCRPAG